MGNHNPNGGRDASDEPRTSWRPQDQSASPLQRDRGNDDDRDYGGWRDRNQDRQPIERDPNRWEGSRGSELGQPGDRSTERYGQGQSGYSAGRYGDDRSQHRHMQNRNELSRGYGNREDRDLGVDGRGMSPAGSAPEWGRGSIDDRFSGRGASPGWRGFESERGGHWHAYDQARDQDRNDLRGRRDPRMGDQPWGNQMGSFERNTNYQGANRSGGENMGYRGSEGYGGTQGGDGGSQGYSPQGHGGTQGQGYRGWQDEPQRLGQHVHRGTGPHRGKGPAGYQRSDDRIRELVSEALADDDNIDASHIHVTVKDGEVTLTGAVDDRRTRREAEDCVSNVPGVRDVQIQLRIHGDKPASSTGQLAPGHAATGPAATSGMASKSDPESDKKHRA